MQKKRTSGWWALAGVVVGSVALAVGLYIGAYFYLVTPTHYLVEYEDELRSVEEALPEYPTRWQKRCESVFAPVHALDRSLRPATWYKRPYNLNPPVTHPAPSDGPPEISG